MHDNLRVKDYGITGSMEATGGPITYYLAHPSEAADPRLDLSNNYASAIDSKVIATKTYPVALNIMQLISATK